MIYDNIKHINNYDGLGLVTKALELLKTTDFESLESGRHEVDGDNIFFMVQRNTTKTDAEISEAHFKYIDIQYIVKGQEKIGVAQIEDCPEPYQKDESADYMLFKCPTQPVVLNEGDFLVLYPNDVHMPGGAVEQPQDVIKIVVKVKASV